MENELAKYRARKQLEYEKQKSEEIATRSSSHNLWSRIRNLKLPQLKLSSTSCETDSENNKLILALKIIFWFLLWGFFIQVEFGTVFLFLSMFYWLYCSMKEGTRRPWEPSAYSVFNENCEAIEGTLSAEQFERELKFGAGAVRKDWVIEVNFREWMINMQYLRLHFSEFTSLITGHL